MITDELLVKVGLKFDDQGKLRNAQGQFINLAKAMAEAEKTGQTLEQVLSKNARAAKEAGVAAASLGKVFAGMQQQILLVAGPVAALALAVKGAKASVAAFADFEQALVGVGKTTNITGDALADLGKQFQMLSQRIPVSAVKLANLAQVAGALGVRGSQNLLNFAETLGKLETATDLVGEDGAQSLKRILDLTNETVDQVDELGSVLVRLGNNFATTESQIVRVSTELARAIGIFGISSANVAALSAALSALGVRAELGGSAVGRTFREIDKAIRQGGVGMETLQKITGMTGEELRKTFAEDSTQVFISFLQGLKRISDEGDSVALVLEKMDLKGDEINKVLPVMANRIDIVTDALKQANEEVKNATALNTEAKRAFETLNAEASKTGNAITNLASDLGQILAPSLKSILKDLGGVTEGLRNFISASRRIGALNVVKQVNSFENLNEQVKELTEQRNKIADTIFLLQDLGPKQDQNMKLKGLLNIFGSLSKANEYMAKSQEDLQDEFAGLAMQISTYTGQANDVVDVLFNTQKAADKTGEGIDALDKKLGKKRPKINPGMDEEGLRKTLELTQKVQSAASEMAKKVAEASIINPNDNIRLANAAQAEQLELIVQEIKLKKELTEEQKKALIASIRATQELSGQVTLLELQKSARETLQDVVKDTIDLSYEFNGIGMEAVELVELQRQQQQQLLNVKQKQLEMDAEINAEAIAALAAQRELINNVAEKRKFEAELDKLPEFAQKFGHGVEKFGGILNKGIEGFNAVFGTTLPQMTGDMIRNVALALAQSISSFEGIFSNAGKGLGKSVMGGINLGIMGVNKALGTTFNALPDKISGALGGIAGAIGAAMDTVVPVIAALFDADFVQGLADTLSDFIEKMPTALVKAFNALVTALGKVIERLPEMVGKLMDNMSVLVAKILDMLPQVIDSLADALGTFLERLPEITARLFDKLPELLDQFLAKLPELITKLFSAVGDIVAQMVAALPDVLAAIFDRLPDIIEAIITGLLDAMGKVAAAFVEWFVSGGAERMVVAFIKMVPRLVVAIVRGIVNGLIKAVGNIFGGFKMPEAFNDIPGKFAEGVKNLAAKVTEEASQLFKVLDLQAAARGLGVAEEIQKAIDAATTRLASIFGGLLAAWRALWAWIDTYILKPIVAAFTFLWDTVKIIFDGIIAAFTLLWEQVVKPIVDTLTTAFELIWTEVISPIVTTLTAGFEKIWNEVIKPIVDTLAGIPAALGVAWENFKTQILEPLKNVGTTIWDGLKAGLDGATQFFKDMGGKIWDGLKAGFDGITNLFDKIFDTSGAFGGGGTVERTLGIDVPFIEFAKGGLVPGNAAVSGDSFLNDKILAMLSPGEAIIPRSKMEDPNIRALVQQVLDGTIKTPRFAFGSDGDFNPFDDEAVTGIFSGLGSAAKAAFSPISGTVQGLLDSTQITKLGAAIDGGLVNLKKSPIGDVAKYSESGLTQAAAIVKAAGGTISGMSAKALAASQEEIKNAGAWIEEGLKYLDPSHLWNVVREEAFSVVMRAFESNKFHMGGLVPAFAGGGEVPAMLQPGEFVMKRDAVQGLGQGFLERLNNGGGRGGSQQPTTVHINLGGITIESDGTPDEAFVRTRLLPAIKKELKSASLNGEFVISQRGVR